MEGDLDRNKARNKVPADADRAQDVPIFLATDVQQKKIRDECSKEETRTLIRNNVNSLARSGYASGSRKE